jgi:hypothetical protein
MCEKCNEIDKNIERYRRIQRTIGDQTTVERTKELIAELGGTKIRASSGISGSILGTETTKPAAGVRMSGDGLRG